MKETILVFNHKQPQKIERIFNDAFIPSSFKKVAILIMGGIVK